MLNIEFFSDWLTQRSGFLAICLMVALSAFHSDASDMVPPDDIQTNRVNVPDVSSGPFEPAILWFGDVTPSVNSTDVRIWYHDNGIEFAFHIIDRRLWYDTTPSAQTLGEWDSVTLVVNMDEIYGTNPTSNSLLFEAQLGVHPDDSRYQASYRGNGSTWEPNLISFFAESSYRGEGGPNTNIDNKGWLLTIVIPFSSLGLDDQPLEGTRWGLGVVVHDRDDSNGAIIPDQVWPEKMDPNNPQTWGQLHFGRYQYHSSNMSPQGIATIQGGFNGADVADAHVGGNFSCGDGLDHWSEWGEATYAGSTQVNIQNQWDIADYPCFSKYFVTFPLASIPAGKVILNAKLTMTLLGNSGGGQWGEPPDSYIQVFTITDTWDESSLNWNNAPLAFENLSGVWVSPTQTSDQRKYSWDVSKAVSDAYQSGTSVGLALYSADGERHTGKYFWSSDSDDFEGTVRPALEVIWGKICMPEDPGCYFTFLPIAAK